jgi:hypothetical protein
MNLPPGTRTRNSQFDRGFGGFGGFPQIFNKVICDNQPDAPWSPSNPRSIGVKFGVARMVADILPLAFVVKGITGMV